VKPLQYYYQTRLLMPTYPEEFADYLGTSIIFQKGHNFVVDMIFFDRFDNVVETEQDPSEFNGVLKRASGSYINL